MPSLGADFHAERFQVINLDTRLLSGTFQKLVKARAYTIRYCIRDFVEVLSLGNTDEELSPGQSNRGFF